jgi:hypothetical protein
MRANGERDLRLDTLRGVMLVMITSMHLGLVTNLLLARPLGPVDPAGGFMLLSGLVAGLVQARIARQRPAVLASKTVRRAARLYRWHAVVVTAVLVTAALVPEVRSLHPWDSLVDEPLPVVLARYLSLHTMTSNFVILPLFIGFTLVTPLLLRMLVHGRAALVVAGSVGFWGLAQLGVSLGGTIAWLTGGLVTPPPAGFDFFAWQLPYVIGLVAGFQAAEGRGVRGDSRLLLGASLVLIAVLTVGDQTLRHPQVLGVLPAGLRAAVLAALAPLQIEGLVAKVHLGPVYLVELLAVAYALTWLGRRRPAWLESRPLAVLGRYSLEVFSFHLVLWFTLRPLAPALHEVPLLASFTFALLSLSVLWVPVALLTAGPRVAGARAPARPASAARDLGLRPVRATSD